MSHYRKGVSMQMTVSPVSAAPLLSFNGGGPSLDIGWTGADPYYWEFELSAIGANTFAPYDALPGADRTMTDPEAGLDYRVYGRDIDYNVVVPLSNTATVPA